MNISSALFGELTVDTNIANLFENSVKQVVVEKPKVPLPLVPKGADEISEMSESESIPEEQNVMETKIVAAKPSNQLSTRKDQRNELIEKNSRTVFAGNLCTSVIEKEHTKELKQLFQQYGPLESIRFRSIAFSTHMPRKEAFLQKKLHEKRDSLNAYIVYKSADDAKKSLELNSTVFLERHIRVDASETKAQKQRDSKRCIFVGNLSFDSTEEALWEAFKDIGEIEYVRLVRDRKTNVGKGFGYVQFADKSSVPLALKLNGIQVSARAIRVTKAMEKLADKGKESRQKKVVEGTRATRDMPVKIKSKKSKPKTNHIGKKHGNGKGKSKVSKK